MSLEKILSSQEQPRSQANQRVIGIFQAANPAVIDIQPALAVIPGMTLETILHAGPPIEWARMCGPMRGAILGALVYEGRAAGLSEAERLVERGEVRLAPNHDHGAVGPMAGVTSPSMPVWVLENAAYGVRAYCNLNEGPGRTLRYGANGPEVITRLHWMRETLAPRLREAVLRVGEAAGGGLPIFPLVREALTMGDECHSRNRAALTLLLQALLPGFLAADLSASAVAEIYNFLVGRDYFFLNLTMAACKAAWLPAESVPGASVVTALSRNGVEFGLHLQGRWFAAPSPVVDGHYFSGFGADDANRDIGDSAITEASGLGGFAAGGAPAVTGFIGGTAHELMEANLEMYGITAAESPHFFLSVLDGRGTPTGIDVLKVAQSGVCPFVTTGIAHREAGVGQVGAGRVRAPLALFQAAAAWLEEQARLEMEKK